MVGDSISECDITLTAGHSRRKRRQGPILLGQHQDEGCSTPLGTCQGRAKATVTRLRGLQPCRVSVPSAFGNVTSRTGHKATCFHRLDSLAHKHGLSKYTHCVSTHHVSGPGMSMAATEPGGSSSRGLLSPDMEAPAHAHLLPTLAQGCRANQPQGVSSRHPALASKPWLLHTGPRGDDAPSSRFATQSGVA